MGRRSKNRNRQRKAAPQAEPRAYGSLENPAVSLDDPAAWAALSGGFSAESGETVNHHSSLSLAPVFQAVSIISGDAAGVRMSLYKQLANGDNVVAVGDPRQFAVHRRANIETSANEFWRRLVAHACLWQNGYAWIRRVEGRPGLVEMYNLLPDRTKLERREDGSLVYWTEVGGELWPLHYRDVFHLKGLSIDTPLGFDLIHAARNAIGLALAAEKFSSRFFKHGAHAGGILEIPAAMTERAADQLEQGFRSRLGSDQWFRTVVLRDGAKFHQTTVDAERSQLHQLREDQVRDVARFFNLPPYKLGVADSQSYNSVEQAQLHYLTGTLWHWLRAIASESDLKLLTETELRQETHAFEHDVDDLAGPDVKTREEILEIRRRNEIISANEWRQTVGYPRRKDKGGDSYENPNTKSAAPAAEARKRKAQARRAKIITANRNLVAWGAGRLARRVAADLRHCAKYPPKLIAWIDTQAQEHRPAFRESLEPIIQAAAAAGAGSAEALCVACEGAFFARALRLAEEAVASATAEQLGARLEELLEDFEVGASAEMVSLVFGPPPEKQAA